MTLRVYNGEKFERGKRWYAGFALILILVIALSLWKNNVIGVVVLFIILGAYLYYSVISNKVISLKITKDHLLIDDKVYAWTTFRAYCLEVEKKSQKLRNLVLIGDKSYLIYTIHDNSEHIHDFLSGLDEHLGFVEGFEQTQLEKLARLLKL